MHVFEITSKFERKSQNIFRVDNGDRVDGR